MADDESKMDTRTSPETVDTGKRSRESDIEDRLTKRSHQASTENACFLKVLVPCVAAGAIIGKGGETIGQLQKDTGAKLKMSKSEDFYPGTTERICLISGNVNAIMSVMDFIREKIREKPDLTSKPIEFEAGKSASGRDKQIKILVPNSTAGMIIGKAGSYIKQVQEESGSYVQISQKAKDVSLQERCVTIVGDKEKSRNALLMILKKIADDPQSGMCQNVSYADINGPVANFNPTGSPYANAPSEPIRASPFVTPLDVNNPASLLNGAGVNLNFNLGAAIKTGTTPVASQVLDHIKLNLRKTGFSEPDSTEILSAISTLAKYNILGMGIGLSTSRSSLDS